MGQDGTAVTASPPMLAMARAILAAHGPAAGAMHKVQEIAAILGVDKSTVYRHIASGKLEAVRAGRSLRVPESAFQDYLRPAAVTSPDGVT